MKIRAGMGNAGAATADSSAPAFKATDYTALLAALGEAGRFEARSIPSSLRRTRRQGVGDPPPSAAVLRDRLRGGEFPADSAAAGTVRPAGSVIAPPGASARGPGPIATMVIAYLALVAASGGTIFYLWGGEHTSVTSIAASVQRFRATVADAVAMRLPAEGEATAVPPPPSASVAIRETATVAAPPAAVEPPPLPPVAAAPVPAPTIPAVAAASPAVPPPTIESAVEEEPAAAPLAPVASAPPSPPAAAPLAAAPVPAPVSPAILAAPAPSTASPVEIARLLRRGDELVATGDIAAARLFYQRALGEGSSRAATALGKTYDPTFLKQIGVRGGGADAAKAAEWYRRASESGDAEAAARLKALRVGAAR
jgi:hypothetical protein